MICLKCSVQIKAKKASPMFTDHPTSAFAEIIVNQTPMIDVRSPVEFKAGAVPSAVNIPLLDDDERHQVGLTYRKKGKEEAFRVANNLVDETK